MTTAQLVFPTQRSDGTTARAKLGSFVHGQLKEKHVNFDNCKIYEHSRECKKQIMVVETDDMSYIGRNFGEDSYKNDNQKTYLGAYNPDTEQLEVYDVDMFKFKPYIPEMEEDSKTSTSDMSIYEQVDLLTSAFGSKRRRKAMEDRKKNLVQDETLKKVLDSTVLESRDKAVELLQNLDDMVQADESQMSQIPPVNRVTTKVEEIFNLSDIISDVDMALLTGPAEEFYKADTSTIEQWTTENKFPLHILRCLKSLPVKEADRWQKCKYLLYLHYLMEFKKKKGSAITQYKDPFPTEWPDGIKKRLLERFTGPPVTMPTSQAVRRIEYRSFTPKHTDRIITYILALGLIMENFTLKLVDLMRDLKIGKSRLAQFARMLGCKVINYKHKNDELFIAELKAPFLIAKSRQAPTKRK